MRKLTFLNFLFLAIIFTSCEDDETLEALKIDLATHSVTFSVEPTSQFEGLATITGTIKNLGDNYLSRGGQQSISLYEKPLGASTGTLVAQKEFTNLNAGETLMVCFTRNWNSSSPAEGEFPPNYVLSISYDPDIYLDSNPANDDGNNSNNRIEKSGSPINDLF